MKEKAIVIGYIIFSVAMIIFAGLYSRQPEPPQIEKAPEIIEEKQPEYVSLGMFEVTAYCPCIKCCGKTDGITASGTKATSGRTIAADTTIFPFGTELYINDHKYIVEDKGGAIKGKKLDIFFETHSEALQWGRRQVEVFIRRQ